MKEILFYSDYQSIALKFNYHIMLFEIFSLPLFLNLRGYGLSYSLYLIFTVNAETYV